MPAPVGARGNRWLWPALTALFAATLAVLFVFNPAQWAFYPVCLFHRVTGFQCPGCGGLRAVHQLLHGEWGAAFHYNPFFVLALPVMAGVFIRAIVRWRRGLPAAPSLPGWAIWGMLGAFVLFGVLRNF